tara:strand:- start:1218 stop:1343 length:126 start_codon:yes stop_codon:yes gene_type:complete
LRFYEILIVDAFGFWLLAFGLCLYGGGALIGSIESAILLWE